jgi:opacity protein-like surface antigen
MPPRLLALVALLVMSAPITPLWAQRTRDQARLIFTVSGGIVYGRSLWFTSPQPVQFTSTADTLALGRRIRSTFTLGFLGSYFAGEHLGFTGEGFFLGLGYKDSCSQLYSSGSSEIAAVCQSIQGATTSATSVVLAAGPVFRVYSREALSPYVRASLGIVISNQSSLRTIGRFPSSAGTVNLIVYDDNHDSRVAPTLALGAGFTTPLASGYQFRWEVRDNIVGIQQVTGPSSQIRTIPPHKLAYKHLFSMTLGFDVVLERRRGRRY